MRRAARMAHVCLLASLAGCALCGEWDGNRQRKQLGPLPGEDQYDRAGRPGDVAPWACPSDTGHYTLYPVGGGAACRGEGRRADEGTWGWDYCGLLLPARIALDWWHGKYQGGGGSYATDGPRPLEKVQEAHQGQE